MQSVPSRPVARAESRRRAAPATGSAVGRILSLQRTIGNAALARVGARRRAVQRVIHPNMAAAMNAVTGGPVNVAGLSPMAQALFTEAEGFLPTVDFVAIPGLNRVAEVGRNPGGIPPWVLNYNPNTPDLNFLTASVLHELLHVSTAHHYVKPAHEHDWVNLDIDPSLNAAASGAAKDPQMTTLEANLESLYGIATNDADPTILPLQQHIQARIDYAGAMSDVHYDTVLGDTLVYLELNGANATSPTVKYLRRLMAEANDRRLRSPWWGRKVPRRVYPDAWAPWAW